MTTMNLVVGATSNEEVDWHSFDWAKIYQNRKEAANAYCKSNTGRKIRQGKSLAVDSDSLVQRQSISCKTSY